MSDEEFLNLKNFISGLLHETVLLYEDSKKMSLDISDLSRQVDSLKRDVNLLKSEVNSNEFKK